MAFELRRDIFTKELEKLGASVRSNDSTHRLIVNDKYEISYTNFYYRYRDSDDTLGQGKQKFIDIIKNEMN